MHFLFFFPCPNVIYNTTEFIYDIQVAFLWVFFFFDFFVKNSTICDRSWHQRCGVKSEQKIKKDQNVLINFWDPLDGEKEQ